jgi:cytochrome c oxidase assembly protein subunit 15
MTLSMVTIGGFTRLSGSGLSITEWKPIVGTIPPITQEQWNEEFQKYKDSPEFIKLNSWMEMKDFQSIYLVEFIHRLFGRLTALCYLLPLIIFYFRRVINRTEFIKFSLIGVFGICQATIGWIMVKSGLVNQPHVSHFKLTFHLLMALVIFSYLIYLYNYYETKKHEIAKIDSINIYNKYNGSLIILLLTQISLGGLLAGLKGGYIYNSFPLMDGYIIAPEVLRDGLFNLNSPIAIQFLHRLLGIIILLYSLFPLLLKSFYKMPKEILRHQYILTIIILTQVTLGIITLVTAIDLIPALLHQLVAFLAFWVCIKYSLGKRC